MFGGTKMKLKKTKSFNGRTIETNKNGFFFWFDVRFIFPIIKLNLFIFDYHCLTILLFLMIHRTLFCKNVSFLHHDFSKFFFLFVVIVFSMFDTICNQLPTSRTPATCTQVTLKIWKPNAREETNKNKISAYVTDCC